jgi:hypothetical protein
VKSLIVLMSHVSLDVSLVTGQTPAAPQAARAVKTLLA